MRARAGLRQTVPLSSALQNRHAARGAECHAADRRSRGPAGVRRGHVQERVRRRGREEGLYERAARGRVDGHGPARLRAREAHGGRVRGRNRGIDDESAELEHRVEDDLFIDDWCVRISGIAVLRIRGIDRIGVPRHQVDVPAVLRAPRRVRPANRMVGQGAVIAARARHGGGVRASDELLLQAAGPGQRELGAVVAPFGESRIAMTTLRSMRPGSSPKSHRAPAVMSHIARRRN